MIYYYSNSQYKEIKDFFDNNRKISVYEVVGSLYGCSRKPYYICRNALTNPEEIIRMAILSQIDPKKITNELFRLTNYSLSDENIRNKIILDGINRKLSLEEINKALRDAGESLF